MSKRDDHEDASRVDTVIVVFPFHGDLYTVVGDYRPGSLDGALPKDPEFSVVNVRCNNPEAVIEDDEEDAWCEALMHAAGKEFRRERGENE